MKQRMVNTRFWVDSWTSNLDPVEKLLFLYLITNERANLCGVYELPLKHMAIESGIEKEMIVKILKRFQKDKKVFYFDGWIYIKNVQKHQRLKNDSIKLGIDRELSELPALILIKIQNIDTKHTSGGDDGGMTGDTKPNLTKPNLTKEAGKPAMNEINEIITLFKDINPSYERLFANKTERAAVERLLAKVGKEQLSATIQALPEIVSKPYAPKVITPYQLEKDMGKLKIFLEQEKNKVGEKKSKVGIII